MKDWVTFLGGNVNIYGRRRGKRENVVTFDVKFRIFLQMKSIFLGKVAMEKCHLRNFLDSLKHFLK